MLPRAHQPHEIKGAVPNQASYNLLNGCLLLTCYFAMHLAKSSSKQGNFGASNAKCPCGLVWAECRTCERRSEHSAFATVQ
eukprot:scaffold2636_cov340-Pavlova_lutheri.AAC.127